VILQDIISSIDNIRVKDSHEIVEHMMILYNKKAGNMLKHSGMGILRRHSSLNSEKLEKYIQAGIENVKELLYSAAEYCLSEDDDTVHHGLATDAYAHATSPIRRYADLVNQRIIKKIITMQNERYIVPIAMYDMNSREKNIKRFKRDLFFLNAVFEDSEKKISGIIIDHTNKNDGLLKVYVYIPTWKRIISARYVKSTDKENTVLSRDEKREIDITIGRNVEIEYGFQLSLRNWKERVIFSIGTK
jgi:flagellar capping protein FliD